MAPVYLWAASEFRLRWRSLAVIAVLVALSAGVVLTAVAGARRGATAVQRLSAVTAPATVQVSPGTGSFNWDAVRRLPEVEALSTYADGSALQIDHVTDQNPYVAGAPPTDAATMRDLERPVVLQGRLFDPARADEAVVTPDFPKVYGFGVGDDVTAHLYSVQQLPQFVQQGPAFTERAAGPTVRIRIVGVVRSPWYSDSPGFEGTLTPSPGLAATYPKNIVAGGKLGALVRLRGGDRDVARFTKDVTGIAGTGHDINLRPLSALINERQRPAAFEAIWLFGFGLAAAIASALLAGQAIARHATTTARDLFRLSAVGMTSGQLVQMSAALPIAASVAGLVAGAGSSAVASRWFPVGSATADEPAPGFAPDPLVLSTGSAIILLFGVLMAIVPVLGVRTTGRLQLPLRQSVVAATVQRAGLPLPAVMGTRFALERSGRAIVRPGLAGSVVGVAGVLAALCLSAAVQDAGQNPVRFGQTWQLTLFAGSGDQQTTDRALALAAADPQVTGMSDTRIASATFSTSDGRARTSGFVFGDEPVGRPLPIVVTDGTPPLSASDVVLGTVTADQLGLTVGDDVTLTGTTPGSRMMHISGLGFTPTVVQDAYDEGAWTTGIGFTASFGQSFDVRGALLALAPGADPRRVQDRLTQRLAVLGSGAAGIQVQAADPLPQQTEVRRINRLPLLLGLFLGLLALGAVGHALVTVARRRRHDLAVLRALGMTRRQVRLALAVQAGVLGLAGLIIGIPLGLALGRTVWRAVADFMPLQYAPPISGPALVLAVPVVLLLGVLLAAVPGQRAARLRVADLLRAE